MGFLGVGLGLVALAILGVMAAARKGTGTTMQVAPQLPAGQPQPQPQLQPIPVGPTPSPGPAAPQSIAEALLFDISPDGTRQWKPAMVAQLLAMFQAYAVVPVNNDPLVVEIVPRDNPAWATAAQWVQQQNETNAIAACRWMSLPVQGQKRFLRVVPPGTATMLCGPGGYYALLGVQHALTTPAAPGWSPPAAPGWPQYPSPAPLVPPVGPIPQVGPVPPVSPIPQVGPVPPVGPMPQAPDAFSAMPPELAAEARKTYQEGQNPDALEVVATQLDKAQYPQAAAAMRARAKELRAKAGIQAAASGQMYQIREGDIPSMLAVWYTGIVGKYRDIPKFNPGMAEKTVNGVTQLVPWEVGSWIRLPPDWDTSKGLPPRKSAVDATAAVLQSRFDTSRKVA